MSEPIDRRRIEELLQDKSLSFRAIAHEVGCSDWSVRSVARRLEGNPRPMKRQRSARASPDDAESADPTAWGVLAGIAALFGGLIWLAIRRAPPPQI